MTTRPSGADWEVAFVLPNADLDEAIERDPCALVPMDDDRVVRLRQRHPKFERLIGSFTDQFERRVHPMALLKRTDAPEIFRTLDALAGFRDAIAISLICPTAAHLMRHGTMPFGGLLWSTNFNFYPWMLDRDNDAVIGRSAAMGGIDEVKRFHGQSDPSVHAQRLSGGRFDRPLLNALLDRWERRFAGSEPSWDDTKLFRSLNMAYHASLVPTTSGYTFYDVGRLVALWISAYEIVAHPGTGHVNKAAIKRLLDDVNWVNAASATQHGWRARGRNGDFRDVSETPARFVLDQLYAVRNGFLHGNRVDEASLQLVDTDRSVFHYAAPIYRLVLTSVLGLRFQEPVLAPEDTHELIDTALQRSNFEYDQRVYEDALLSARELQSADDRRTRRQRRQRT